MTALRDVIDALSSPEDRLRAAALSFRSICEHSHGTALVWTSQDGHQLAYTMGEGIVLLDPAGGVVASYPESALDSEQWTVAP